MSDKGIDRMLAGSQAKVAWAQASQECQIRHGAPTDADQFLAWGLEVENDEAW